jgi:hypothetical protein
MLKHTTRDFLQLKNTNKQSVWTIDIKSMFWKDVNTTYNKTSLRILKKNTKLQQLKLLEAE